MVGISGCSFSDVGAWCPGVFCDNGLNSHTETPGEAEKVFPFEG